MTGSLHKLTAGSGYDYLTRQVAVQDVTEKGHSSLASYYSERGEVPGRWRGSGVAGLGDLAVGDVVTQEQMQALFGAGFHPNAEARLAALPAGASKSEIEAAGRLGVPYKVYSAATEFRLEVEDRQAAWRAEQGLGESAVVPVDVRAEIVNGVARERFVASVGREPSADELASHVARLFRNPTTACAGYDVTFTPVKSVSALWAVAPEWMAAEIERAHDAAVDDALRFVEEEVLYSRAGANGVRQIEVRGLVAASFTHRDSRAGDPNLHTHVAIANKVQAVGDGKWRSIDGRMVFKAMVSVSEVYNSQLEAHLRDRLGLRFVERPSDGRELRGVREVVGVSADLVESWSSRRALIEARQAELAVDFQRSHGRAPTPAESIRLAQQATLETREAKHEPRSLAEQRAAWADQATRVLGVGGVERMVAAVQGRGRVDAVSGEDLARVAVDVVERVSRDRATWQVWHLRAEALRRVREFGVGAQDMERLAGRVLELAVGQSVPIGPVGDGVEEPAALRRSDGVSMYEVAGAQRFTSQRVMDAEQLVCDAAGLVDGRRVEGSLVDVALLESVANGLRLSDGQAHLVRELAASGRRVQLALAAAGTGKTTAMRVLARAWEESGGTLLGLAPSAVAAGELRDAVGAATTVAKLVWDLEHGRRAAVDGVVGPGTLLVVDEAGMVDTLSLSKVVSYALERGASVRLVGDDQQLAAVGSGGVLRDVQRTHGAAELNEVLRFVDTGERRASMALRAGDPDAIGWYLDHGRVHAGSRESAMDGVLRAWLADQREGRESLMLAGSREDVAELNHRAQGELFYGEARMTSALRDGNEAGVGDVVLTRMNDARLRVSDTDWVKNGDRWLVEDVHPDGALRVRHRDSGLGVVLPANYVRGQVELGYATTVHSAQGVTVDMTHTVVTGAESRQQLYVAMSRGRLENHAWVAVVGDEDEHAAFTPETLRPVTAADVLDKVVARDGSSVSATTEQLVAQSPARMLQAAVDRYHDAVLVAVESRDPGALERLEGGADGVVAGLTESPAWPTLRQRLLLTAAPEEDLLENLRELATGHRWEQVEDPGAVLAAAASDGGGGPLPWLPRIPAGLDTEWHEYLQARADLVKSLAGQVRAEAMGGPAPAWLPVREHTDIRTIGDAAVWRAARGVEETDRRALGEPVELGSAGRYQQALAKRLVPLVSRLGVGELARLGHRLKEDSSTAAVARKLSELEQQGVDVVAAVEEALSEGPLPAEKPAGALRWRLEEGTTANPLSDKNRPSVSEQWLATFQQELGGTSQWPTIRAMLRRLEGDGVDVAGLAPQLSGQDGRQVRATLQRILMNRAKEQAVPPKTAQRHPRRPGQSRREEPTHDR